MSADNWAICPKCNADKIAAKEKLHLKAGAAYGKVAPAEYLKMLEAANMPTKTEETLREDYELGVNKDGVFEVSYSCSCSECTFGFRYKHSEATWAAADSASNRKRKNAGHERADE